MREIMRIKEDVIPFKKPERSVDPVGKTVRDSDDALVDLRQHKFAKAFGNDADEVSGMVQGEWGFFAGGKFGPFAKTYIDSNFDPKLQPTIELTVRVCDHQP